MKSLPPPRSDRCTAKTFLGAEFVPLPVICLSSGKLDGGVPGVHDFVAIEWLISNPGEERDSKMVRSLIGQLDDEPDAFGVALCALFKHGFEGRDK